MSTEAVEEEEFKVEDYHDECRIVVIDDSNFSRRTIVKALEEQRLNVVGEASNAKDAFNIISRTEANIIITDIVMPDVSGIDLAKKFNDGFAEKYFIFVSSLARESIIVESISAGAVDFLQKPFKKEDLQQSVLKVCKRIAENL